MRELEREPRTDTPLSARLAIIGRGRIGTAIATALADTAQLAVIGPLGRGAELAAGQADAVLLCVPDAAIAAVAGSLPAGPLVGHCSGATGLDALGEHPAFSLHPLMTVSATAAASVFSGAGAAVDGTTPRARAFARELAQALGMHPVQVAAEDRAAYHAAASIASNYLVTLEGAAERLAASAGVDRAMLVPLVRRAVENWSELGPAGALTGPVARGDEATVAAQRAAVAERAPELLELFDACTDSTRALAREALLR